MKQFIEYYFHKALILLGIKGNPEQSQYTHDPYPASFLVTKEALNDDLYSDIKNND